MDKILKLTKSPNKDDLEIGIRLLLSLPFEDIMSFFKAQGRNITEGHIDVSIKYPIVQGTSYVDLGNNFYFIHFHLWLRLKDTRKTRINKNIPVISLKEYLYGEDT